MKTLSLSFVAVYLFVALNFSIPAQQPAKARGARQKSAQPQKKSAQPVADKAGKQEQQGSQSQPSQSQPEANTAPTKKDQKTTIAEQAPEMAILDRFNGTWAKDIDVMYPSSIAGGAFSISMSSAGVKGTVTRPNKSTVSVKFSSPEMAMYDKVVTLKYDLAIKKYLLTVKSTSGPSLEDFPLSFSEESGFIGEGRTPDNYWAVSVSIKKKGESNHHWDIKFRGDGPNIRAYIFTLEPKEAVK